MSPLRRAGDPPFGDSGDCLWRYIEQEDLGHFVALAEVVAVAVSVVVAAVAAVVAAAGSVAGTAAAVVGTAVAALLALAGAAVIVPLMAAPPAVTLEMAGVVSQTGIPPLGISSVSVKKRRASDILFPPTHSPIRQTPWEPDNQIQGER